MLSVRQKMLSWINSLGTFLLKGRSEATAVAILSAAIPFLGWASLVVVCLVTLRKGVKEGLFVLAWGMIPALISSYLMGSAFFALETFFAYVFLWGVAGLLRATTSWGYVLEVSSAIAIAVIVFFHWQIPDLEEYYLNYLMDLYRSNGTDRSNDAVMQGYVQYLVYFLLGIETTLYMIHNLLCLLIARWLQAVLYNPKGLSNELKTIRLSWFFWLFAVIFLFFGIKMSPSWALDSLPVFIALFFFAGWSIAHYLISMKLKFQGAVFVFYFLLILLFPASIVPIMLLALIDTGWNIRKKI